MTLAISVSLLSGQSASVSLEKHCSVDELRKAAEAKLEANLGALVAQGASRVSRRLRGLVLVYNATTVQ